MSDTETPQDWMRDFHNRMDARGWRAAICEMMQEQNDKLSAAKQALQVAVMHAEDSAALLEAAKQDAEQAVRELSLLLPAIKFYAGGKSDLGEFARHAFETLVGVRESARKSVRG